MVNLQNIRQTPVLVVFLALLLALAGCRTTTPYPGAISEQTIFVGTGLKLGNIDRSIRPQDDLYGYANGLWLQSFNLPEDRSSFGIFNFRVDEVSLFLNATMEDILVRPNNQLRAEERKLKNLFESYFNLGAIEAQGLTGLQDFFGAVEGVRSAGDLTPVFAMFARFQTGMPFSLIVEEDPADASKFLFHIEQSGLGMPGRDFYMAPGERAELIRSNYINYIETLFTLAGYGDPAAMTANVYALETRLAGVQWQLADTRDKDKILNVVTRDELVIRFPGIDWNAFFAGVGDYPTDRVVVRQPDYLEALGGIVGDVAPGVWRDYLTFHLLNTFAQYLPPEFTEARFDFYFRTLTNVNAATPRERAVLNVVNLVFQDVFAKAYMREYYDQDIASMVEAMAMNMKEAFRRRLMANTWMSGETRRNALAKLDTLKFRIGGPSEWIDYSSLSIRDNDLMGNMLNFHAFDFTHKAQQIISGRVEGRWPFGPQTVNAFYYAAQNEIVVPLAILQSPIFDPTVDMAANYGALGAIIGHEVIHAFDDQGRKFDAMGQHRNWWEDADAAYFNDVAGRLAERYSTFSPLPGYSIDGRQTLGENIGDVEGLALAFEAYKLTINGTSDIQMAGFNGEQRFFLGWAQLWARVSQEAELRRSLLTGVHSPGKFRVNGVIQNLDGFYDAFGVTRGDALYLPPDERIRIW